jgi:hypothetical protein
VLVRRCALILEPAGAAGLHQVNPRFLAVFISGEVVCQLLAGQPAIGIVWPNGQNQVCQNGLLALAPELCGLSSVTAAPAKISSPLK